MMKDEDMGDFPPDEQLPEPVQNRDGASLPLASETAIAMTYNGSTEAVLMATPANLEDFAYGFSMTEGLASPDEIEKVEPFVTPLGIDVQIWVSEAVNSRLAARRRRMIGPVGCGLCGIDTLTEAMRNLPSVAKGSLRLKRSDLSAAIDALGKDQPIREATRATHAAAFWSPDAGVMALREDVGRHNALDKLAGAIRGMDPQSGAVVLSSRVSLDLVQKTAMMGVPVIIAVSAPTATAVDTAASVGITIAAPVRRDRIDLFGAEGRIID